MPSQEQNCAAQRLLGHKFIVCMNSGDDGPPPFVLGSMVDMGEQKGWQKLSADDYRANLSDAGQPRVYLDAGTWTGEAREWKRSGLAQQLKSRPQSSRSCASDGKRHWQGSRNGGRLTDPFAGERFDLGRAAARP